MDLEKLDALDRSLITVTSCRYSDRGHFRLGFLNQTKNPLDRKLNRIFKRSLDILLSIPVLLFLLSWLVPLLAILNRLRSRDSIFLLEKRKKRRGDIFTSIRFSTEIPGKGMVIQASGKMNRQANLIGRFLKDHHLEVLPQFVNVLLGDMSIVGPRSFKEEDALHYEQVLSGYSRRYSVKPGIFGLDPFLQDSYPRGNIQKMKARTRLDLFYIGHWSASLDFKLILRSLRKMIGIGLNYSQNNLRDFS